MRDSTRRIIVTGSSGFIGTHLCKALVGRAENVTGIDIRKPMSPMRVMQRQADIAVKSQFRASDRADVVIHLAAEAEVVIPFKNIARLTAVNVNGTIYTLEACHPKLLLSASSSAVYGCGKGRSSAAAWPQVNPVGVYGMSKAMAELACQEWVRDSDCSAVSFRFGNVTGAGCRGFIPYLVKHALAHPDGEQPAQCRGFGGIVRDYVPVDYVVRVLCGAMDADWKPGGHLALNVGTGRGTTNLEVGEAVRRRLKKHGYKLRFRWENPLAAGEASRVVLDMKTTTRKLGLPPPDKQEVMAAIDVAVDSYLARKKTA